MAEENSNVRIKDIKFAEFLEPRLFKICLGVFVIAITIYGLYFTLVADAVISEKSEDWGTFGDFVGGLTNPIIALSVLYFVYRSFKIQKTELKETREALRITSEEAIKQTRIQKLEVKIIFLKQAIEQTKEGKLNYNEYIKNFTALKKNYEEKLLPAKLKGNKILSNQYTKKISEVDTQIERLNNEIDKLQEAYHKFHDDFYELQDELSKI